MPKILFSLIPTIVPSLSLDKTSTFLETLFTIGARIKTALIFSCIPLKVMSDSKESTCLPNQFLETSAFIKFIGIGSGSVSFFAIQIRPAHVPQTDIPSETFSFISPSKSYLSISFLIVVDSPPGIIKPLMSESWFGFLTMVQLTLRLSKTLICSAKSPCSASTPILTLDLTNLFFQVSRMDLF